MRKYSIWNTIKVNFIALPWRIAWRLPIYVGPHCEVVGLRKGCIEIAATKFHRRMILLGASRHSIYPRNECWTYLRFGARAKLILAPGVRVHQGVYLVMPRAGRIELGEGTLINQRSLLYAASLIRLGRHCRVGWNVQIMDNDAHFVYSEKDNTFANYCKPTVMANNVWIASQCTVRKGSVLPAYSILSGGSLLTRDYSAVTTKGNVFTGSPAVLKATGYYRLIDGKLEQRLFERTERDASGVLKMDDGFDIRSYLS